jgi:hypothetical protein
MPGIESFGGMPSSDPTREELENTQQMPVIESGIASIKLALFTRLLVGFACRRPQIE